MISGIFLIRFSKIIYCNLLSVSVKNLFPIYSKIGQDQTRILEDGACIVTIFVKPLTQ